MMTLSRFFSLDFGPSEASAKKFWWGLLDRCVENFHGHKWKQKKKYHKWKYHQLEGYFDLLTCLCLCQRKNHWGNNGRKKDTLLYLSLLNLRECRIAGIFCLRFHRWMLSSAKALTSAPWGGGSETGRGGVLSESTKDLVACFIWLFHQHITMRAL